MRHKRELFEPDYETDGKFAIIGYVLVMLAFLAGSTAACLLFHLFW